MKSFVRTAGPWAVGAGLVLALCLVPCPARAQAADAALAQSLFDQARQLMAARRYREACPLFAESQRLDPGGGTLLNLAICHEGEGKLATAWGEFNAALGDATRNARKGREQIARSHIAALEPRLSHLTVLVASRAGVPGLAVSLDGNPMTPATWGIPVAVDPGTHRLEASAPGFQVWSAILPVGQEGDSHMVEIPALAPIATATHECPPLATWDGTACAGTPAVPVAPAPSPEPVAPSHPSTLHVTYRIGKTSSARYVVGGLGAAALGTSLVTGIVAWTDRSAAHDDCNLARNYCSSQSGLDSVAGERTWGWVSTASLGAGVVGAAVFLLWPSPERIPIVSATPLPGGAAITVRGAL